MMYDNAAKCSVVEQTVKQKKRPSANEKAEGWNSNNNQSDHYTGQRQETGHFYYCVENNGKNNKDNRPEIQRNRCKK